MIFGEMRLTDPFNDTFEKAGYDSTNFFYVCGPIVLIVIAFLIWVPLRKLLQRASQPCRNNFVTRRLKK